MSDDFQKLFKEQLKNAIITDESKQRMDRVQGKDDDSDAVSVSADISETTSQAPATKPAKKTARKKKAKPAPGSKKKGAAASAPTKDVSGSTGTQVDAPDEALPEAAAPHVDLTEPAGTPADEVQSSIRIDLDGPEPDQEPAQFETVTADNHDSPTPIADEPSAEETKPETTGESVAPTGISIDLDAPLPEDEAPEATPASAPKAATPTATIQKTTPKEPAMASDDIAPSSKPDTDAGTVSPVLESASAAAPATSEPRKSSGSADSARDKGPEALQELAEDEGGEDLEHKFLTFHIGNEIYGLEIGHVTEIIGIQKITEVPDMPDFIKGVINLRGEVIPVVEVRLRFGMETREYDDRTCVVVVRHKDTVVGLVVDTVSEVLDIPSPNISPAPRLGRKTSSRFVRAMGRVGDEVRILLDLRKFLYDGYIAND